MRCVGNTDLIFFSITEEDVPVDKLGIFNVLKERKPPVKCILQSL